MCAWRRTGQGSQRHPIPRWLPTMQAMRSDSRCLVRDGLCGREQDCIRDLDYFKANAIWHQAAHDMIGDNGPRG